ncbi:MAG: amidohydrolase family protein [Phycisphaerales bacterium]|nr:amidohydrolase family protein [Phycisphaerales bacterium]
MLIAGLLFQPDSKPRGLVPGWLLVQAATILDVGTGPPPARPDLGGDDCCIFPGFIDAHVHLPQFDSIGVAGLELLDWLEKVIFPAESRWEDPAFAADMAERATDELISFGTTAFAAYGTVHSESVRQAMTQVASRHVRALFGPSLMDRNAPPNLCYLADDQIEALSRFTTLDRVEPAVTPRFAVACSPDLMTQAAQLARARGWAIQTHLAETHAELALVSSLFAGRPYTQVYEDCGLLTPRTILAHGIHLDDAQRALLHQRGCTLAHCPTANRFLHAGAMDRAATLAGGVRLALGSDVAGGPDRSMVRVARAMIETAWSLGHEAPSARDCFHLITRGNAEALGWSNCGRLAPSFEADLVVIRPTITLDKHPDPLGALLHGWDDRWIQQTVVAGVVEYDIRWRA